MAKMAFCDKLERLGLGTWVAKPEEEKLFSQSLLAISETEGKCFEETVMKKETLTEKILQSSEECDDTEIIDQSTQQANTDELALTEIVIDTHTGNDSYFTLQQLAQKALLKSKLFKDGDNNENLKMEEQYLGKHFDCKPSLYLENPSEIVYENTENPCNDVNVDVSPTSSEETLTETQDISILNDGSSVDKINLCANRSG